jgi:hypothetical protein
MPLRASKGAGGGMTDRDEAPPKGRERPGGGRRWCEDFASRAGTYPFPLRTPAHGWPARPKRTRYVVAAPPGTGVLGTCDCVDP